MLAPMHTEYCSNSSLIKTRTQQHKTRAAEVADMTLIPPSPVSGSFSVVCIVLLAGIHFLRLMMALLASIIRYNMYNYARI